MDNGYVLPVMVYGSEKKAHVELLSVAQRKMERSILVITLFDHNRVDTARIGQDGREDLEQDGSRELIRHLGPSWPIVIARDRGLWKQFRERFILTE